MTFKVKRSLLVAALKREQEQLKQEHEKALAQFEKALPAHQSKLIDACEQLVKKAKAGTLKVDGHYKGQGTVSLPAIPTKPKPDCRIAEINELQKLLALNDDEYFTLTESSKFYRYTCKI